MAITTKKGDFGKTTFNNQTVAKDSPLIELIGTIDELCAHFVYLCSLDHSDSWKERVFELSELAAFLTGYREEFCHKFVTALEDTISGREEPFRFKYPFDDSYKAEINIARTVARRLERNYISYAGNDIDASISSYLNRLSDYLYVLV